MGTVRVSKEVQSLKLLQKENMHKGKFGILSQHHLNRTARTISFVPVLFNIVHTLLQNCV